MDLFITLMLFLGVTLVVVWGVGALIKYAINKYYDRQSELSKKNLYACPVCLREDAYKKIYEGKYEYIETRKKNRPNPVSADPSLGLIGTTYKIIRYHTTYGCIYCKHTKVNYREYQQRL